MKTINIILIAMLFCITLTKASATDVLSKNPKLPDSKNTFHKNMGQWSSDILYDGYAPGIGKARLRANGISFCATRKIEEETTESKRTTLPSRKDIAKELHEANIWNLIFINSNKDVKVTSVDEQKSVYTYINERGTFPKVPESTKIKYTGIYKNVDIEYYTSKEGLKYDFILVPGANIKDLLLSYDGIDKLAIEKGELKITTKWFTYTENIPAAYQNINGEQIPVAVEYKLLDNTTYGFAITGKYDATQPLVIDPFFRDWGTYLMAQDGYSRDNAMDAQGNVYLTGWIAGQYPTTAGTVTANGASDAYIAKLSTDGTSLIYFTLVGGNSIDIGNSIAVDLTGAAYITGMTISGNFPVSLGAYDVSHNSGFDAFVTKIDALGTGIVYSTFIGGEGWDIGNDITIDNNTSVYLTGETNSLLFPVTPGVVQNSYSGGGGTNDAFITCVNPSGTNISFSTYFGGTNDDISRCIYRKSNGDIYIGGNTRSNDFPTSLGAFQATYNGSILYDLDGFVTKINGSLSTIAYSTYLGNNGDNSVEGIDVNGLGEAFVTGYTYELDSIVFFDTINNIIIWSTTFPTTPGVIQPFIASYNNSDAFVTRFNNTGTNLIYSTLLGGTNEDQGTDINVTSTNEVYIVGFTGSSNFPILNPPAFQTSIGGGYDLFLSNLNSTATAFACGGSTFIGGSSSDYTLPKMTLDSSCTADIIVINGTSHSPNFPTTAGSYEPTKINGTDDQPVAMKLFVCDSIVFCDSIPLGDPHLSIGSFIFDDTVCAGSCVTVKAPVINGFATPNNLQVYCPGATVQYYNQDTLRITICFPGTAIGLQHIRCEINGGYPNIPFWIDFTVLPAPAAPNVGQDRLICPGSAITLATSAITGITYSWTGPNFFTSTSSHVSVTTPGTYIITATNAIGCSASDSITLFTLDDMPNTFLTYNNCHQSNGVQLNAGYGATSYSWSPATGLSNASIQNPIANPAVTTTYTVTATFANGCVATGDVMVTVPPVPAYSIGAPLTICEGSCVKLSVPTELSSCKATWFYSTQDGPNPSPTDNEIFGTGSSICFVPTKSGNYCVTVVCGECTYTICRQITVVPTKECKKLPVTDNRCCDISTQRVSKSVENNVDLSSFAVYPNPVKDNMLQLSFKVLVDGHAQIKLFDVAGKEQIVLFNGYVNGNETKILDINTSQLSSGIYFVTLESANTTKTIKLVKQ